MFSVQIPEIPKTIHQTWLKLSQSCKIKQHFENNLQLLKLQKCSTKFCSTEFSRIFNTEWIPKVQNCVNLVDLVKSFQTSILYLLLSIYYLPFT